MILLSYSALSLLWDVEDLVLLLAAFIQLQQIDAYTYEDSNPESKRNWEDWGESAMYFKSICKPVLVSVDFSLVLLDLTFWQNIGNSYLGRTTAC